MRRWSPDRQAYVPRLWIMIVPTIVACEVLAFLLNLRLAVLIPAAFLIGVAGSQIQWALWRHRHPVVTTEQWVRAKREAAPWN